MRNAIRTFLASEEGPTAVEYAVMLAMIVIACIGAVNAMAVATANSFDDSASLLEAVFGS
jgi:pilus assembly protein Flp/PilA